METLSYLTHHFQLIKNVISNCNQINVKRSHNHSDSVDFQIAQQHEKVLQSVALMEKKISYNLQNREPAQFEDFITQFYEEQLNKVRNQLQTTNSKVKSLQKQTHEGAHFIGNRSPKQNLQQSPCSDFNTTSSSCPTHELDLLQSKEHSLKLKKELANCQSLLKNNQQFIHEQNLAIRQLSSQLRSEQQKQHQSRLKYEAKVKELDAQTGDNRSKFHRITQEFHQNRKVYDHQIKQLEVENEEYHSENQQIQSELLLKTEEIKLLSKKVYDLELVIDKYEHRELVKKSDQQHTEEALLLLDKELQICKGKYLKVEAEMNEKLSQKDAQCKQYERQNAQLKSEVLKLETKITDKYEPSEISHERREKLNKEQIKQMTKEIEQLERSIRDLQNEKKTTIRQCKALEKKAKQLSNALEETQQQLKESTQTKASLENRLSAEKSKAQKEKYEMKRQIMVEVEELLKVNQETVKRIKEQEKIIIDNKTRINESQKSLALQQQENKNKAVLIEEINRRVSGLMRENEDLNRLRKQLQLDLQSVKQELEESEKFKIVAKKQEKSLKEKQKLIQKQEKEIASSQQSMSALETQLTTLKNEQHSQQPNSCQQETQEQELKCKKQQIHLKDFQIKQLESRCKVLQEEVRDVRAMATNEKLLMGKKIKELEQLLKERYDFSNRPSNCG